MACCSSCADGHPSGCASKVGANRPYLIRGGAPLGFIGPLMSAVSAISTARSLGAFGSCPEARTAGNRLYSAPWEGSAPTYGELSDWYDKAEEEIGRAKQTQGVPAVALNKLEVAWERLPNRLAAMADRLANATQAKEIAQRALCLFHDATQGTNTPIPDLPEPTPDDGCSITKCCPTDPRPNEPYPKCKVPTFSLPWWVFAAGGAAIFLLLSNRNNDRRR